MTDSVGVTLGKIRSSGGWLQAGDRTPTIPAMSIASALRALSAETLSRAVAVQQIPAPTFAESERARWVADRVRDPVVAIGGDVEILPVTSDTGDPVNVVATLPGPPGVPPLLISAHTDTVFPAQTDLSVTGTPNTAQIAGPGIGDNSLAVAALLSVAEVLAEHPLPVPVILLANAGEEGRGDLCGINAALDLLEIRGQRPGAAVVLEGLALGRVYHAGIGVKRYQITVRGPGGHSWGDAGTPSAVHELVGLLTELCTLELPVEPRASLNIGVISGGRSINTIADVASAELDLRSASADGIATLDSLVSSLVTSWTAPTGVSVQSVAIGNRPAGSVPPDHPLITAALDAATAVPPRLQSGSTDANALFARSIPAVCVGVTTGGNAHRLDEYIDTAPVPDGLAQLGALLERASALIANGGGLQGGSL